MENVEVVALIEFDLGFEAVAHAAERKGSDEGSFVFGLQTGVEKEAFGAEESECGEGARLEAGWV